MSGPMNDRPEDLPEDLDALRREIDEIDDSLHQGLMRRTELVHRIAEVKERDATANGDGAVYLRPGREAALLRRRLDRHAGELPRAVIARIWREMIGAFGQLQKPLRVLVHAPSKSVGYWDLARNHFGSIASMSMHVSAQRVLTEVANSKSAIGILTEPEEDEQQPWWPHFVLGVDAGVQVIARLPFFASATGRFEDLSALVVAPFAAEPSGDDVSLIVVETSELSRAWLSGRLAEVGFDNQIIVGCGGEDGTQRLHLVQIKGFVAKSDARIGALQQKSDGAVQRIGLLGAYATPLGQLD